MLQIAIWAMAIMLVVKALDIAHRDDLALAVHGKSKPRLAWAAFIIAVGGAVWIVFLANAQVSETSRGLGNVGAYIPSQSYTGDRSNYGDAAVEASKAAYDAIQGAADDAAAAASQAADAVEGSAR